MDTRPPDSGEPLLLVLAVTCGCLAAICLYDAVEDASDEAHRWVVSSAVVQSSEVTDDFRGLRVAVRYTYEFEGRTYEGDRLAAVRPDLRDRAEAEALAARYRTPDPVPVYVDPEAPARAVLHPRTGIEGYVALATGAILGLLALGLGVGWAHRVFTRLTGRTAPGM